MPTLSRPEYDALNREFRAETAKFMHEFARKRGLSYDGAALLEQGSFCDEAYREAMNLGFGVYPADNDDDGDRALPEPENVVAFQPRKKPALWRRMAQAAAVVAVFTMSPLATLRVISHGTLDVNGDGVIDHHDFLTVFALEPIYRAAWRGESFDDIVATTMDGGHTRFAKILELKGKRYRVTVENADDGAFKLVGAVEIPVIAAAGDDEDHT